MEPEPQPHDALIGTILADRYQIEERIGAGAMGAVYKARHIKVGRLFAVKLLHVKLLDDEKLAQRFEREAELAGRLRHVNVIGVIDVGETPDGIRYMVMDFAEGQDLADLLAEAPMPAPRIINLVRQMLEGLFHAHEHGLIHRDFKPENVIVERDQNGVEVPRIIDFGIAILHDAGASVDADGRLTTNGLVLGTPHYMAPEQAVSDPLDHRVDLFALGIVIYEMLCGKLPYEGSGAEVARANLMLDPPPIIARVPHLEVDPLLEAFARLLMAKRRDQRPATARVARELLDLIERDPDAAAIALNVPRTVDRGPKPTAPSTPIPGTVPVVRAGTAPPMTAPVAMLSERDLATSVTGPLDFQRPARHRGLWIAVIGGGAVAIAVVAVVLLGGRGAPAPAPAQLAVQQPDAAIARPEVVQPPTPVAPIPVVPLPVVPPPVVHKPAAPIHKPGLAIDKPAVVVKPVIDKPVIEPPVVKPVDKPIVKPVDPPPVDKPIVTKPIDPPPKPGEITTTALAAEFTAAGVAIKALQGEADDLVQRYRMIQIQQAMATPESRAKAFATLSAIHREAVVRGKSR